MLFSIKHVPKQKLYKHVYTTSVSEIICHFYVASVMLFFKHVPQKRSYIITSYIRWKIIPHFYKINNAIFSNMYQNKWHYFPSLAVHWTTEEQKRQFFIQLLNQMNYSVSALLPVAGEHSREIRKHWAQDRGVAGTNPSRFGQQPSPLSLRPCLINRRSAWTQTQVSVDIKHRVYFNTNTAQPDHETLPVHITYSATNAAQIRLDLLSPNDPYSV